MGAMAALALTGMVLWLAHKFFTKREYRRDFIKSLKNEPFTTIFCFLWISSILIFFWCVMLPPLRDVEISFGRRSSIYLWQLGGIGTLAGAVLGAIGSEIRNPSFSRRSTPPAAIPPPPAPAAQEPPPAEPPPSRQEFAVALAPLCPECGARMRKRVARRGRWRGREFWGCSRYPGCTGIRNIPQ